MRRFLTAAAIAWLATTWGFTEAWRFEALPKVVDGVELSDPVAIADDGAILFRFICFGSCGDPIVATYKHGDLDVISFDPASGPFPSWQGADLNERGDIVGVNTVLSWFPDGPPKVAGFVRHADGTIEIPPILPTRVNNRGAIAGVVLDCPGCADCPIEFCNPPAHTPHARLLIDGVTLELPLPDSSSGSSVVGLDDAGSVLGWSGMGADRRWFLLEGDRLSWLEPPAVPAPQPAMFLDLNNRGQMLGFWTEFTPDGVHLRHSFIREADGTIRPIEWDYAWPETLSIQAWNGEEVIVHLGSTHGIYAMRLNDRGEVLALISASYAGRFSNGTLFHHFEQNHGVGRPHP
jgi:hypothetical protein